MRLDCVLVRFVSKNTNKNARKRQQAPIFTQRMCNIEKLCCVLLALGNFFVFFLHFLAFLLAFLTPTNARKIQNASETKHNVIRHLVFITQVTFDFNMVRG